MYIRSLTEDITTIKEDPDSASNLFPLATKGVFAGVDIIILHCLVDIEVRDKKLETDTRIARKMKVVVANGLIGIFASLVNF